MFNKMESNEKVSLDYRQGKDIKIGIKIKG
jgi:hypothetical protein